MGKKFFKIILSTILTFSLIISQAGCSLNKEEEKIPKTQPVTMDGFFLDTVCTISIYDKAEEEGNEIINKAFSKIQDYEKIMSKTLPDSDVSSINNGHSDWVKVDLETINVIKKGLEYSRLSKGVFDISCGGLTDLWDFHIADDVTHKGGTVPDSSDIKEQLKHIDYTKIKIDEKKSAVKLEDPKTQINLGGIAKGYIADKIADYIESLGTESAIVNLGGNIVSIGGKIQEEDKKKIEDFKIGVKNPLSTNGELLGYIQDKDLTVVTSGTYERYFVVNGKKYHHILDTKLGMPCETDLMQVTIISPRGKSTDSDGISTACLALGEKAGIEFINKINASEKNEPYMAIFLNKDGSHKVVGERYKFVIS